MTSFFFPFLSSLPPCLFFWSGTFAHRGDIQLSPLHRNSTGASALRSLNASHRMIRGITRRRIMRFIILMRQPAKQDLHDDGESRVNVHRDNPCKCNPLCFSAANERWPPRCRRRGRNEAGEAYSKSNTREARDKRSEMEITIIGAVRRVSRDVRPWRTLHAVQDGRRFDGKFDGVQGNFVIHRAEHPGAYRGSSLAVCSRPLMRSWLCVPSSISVSLPLSCRASRCRKRVLLVALPKKRYKTGASWAWPEGRKRKRRARGNRTWRTLAERNGNGCGEVNG